jgi:hypothetical protein
LVNTNEKVIFAFPCGIGDGVYFIPSKVNYELNILNGMAYANRVYHQKVARISVNKRGWYLELQDDLEYGTDRALVDDFYKETWFLTQEEAEHALENLEQGSRKEESDGSNG